MEFLRTGLDLINKIEGVGFQEVWEGKIDEKIQIDDREVPVYYIGLNELIQNKVILSRPKDQEDLKYLKEIKKRRSKK